MAEHRKTPIDFARAEEADSREEIRETLAELVQSFGISAVSSVASTMLVVRGGASQDTIASALRSFCVLLAESDRPKLTAILVGKLVKLDVVAGRPVILAELARENGISKQAVSNRMKAYAARIGLPRLESSERAREAHRLTNRRNFGGSIFPG